MGIHTLLRVVRPLTTALTLGVLLLSVDTAWAADEHFRRCMKCSSLFPNGGSGSCAGGGTHQQDSKHSYYLPTSSQSYPWQREWWVCTKCSTLFNGVLWSTCMAGGQHQNDPAASQYYLARDNRPAGFQPGWKYCGACHLLHYQPLSGACPKLNVHTSSSSSDYAVRHTAAVPPQAQPAPPIEQVDPPKEKK